MKESIFEQTRRVYNKLGRDYLNASKHLDPIERSAFRKAFPKGSKILDVGCAGGRDTKFFVSGGLKVTGVDASDVFIEEARKFVPDSTFIQGDLLKINFPKETFEGVWAQAVLLHLKRKDVPRAIRKFHRILKSGGLLHVRVKKGTGEAYVKEKLSGGNERFYTYFSKKEMVQILKDAGFKIVYSGIFPDQLKRMDSTWIALWARKI